MRADRLRKLAFYLRNEVKDERFNLATWAGNDDIEWGGMPDLSCGTTACAMGWATTIPEFQAEGLALVRMPTDRGYYPPTVSFNGKTHFMAAAEFCGISQYEAEYLFDPSQYPDDDKTSRLDVCERIEEFVAYGGIPGGESRESPDEEGFFR